jgi:hypothetical protein
MKKDVESLPRRGVAATQYRACLPGKAARRIGLFYRRKRFKARDQDVDQRR